MLEVEFGSKETGAEMGATLMAKKKALMPKAASGLVESISTSLGPPLAGNNYHAPENWGFDGSYRTRRGGKHSGIPRIGWNNENLCRLGKSVNS